MIKPFCFCLIAVGIFASCSSRLIDEIPPGDTLAEGQLLRHTILSAGESAIDFTHQFRKTRGKRCRQYDILDTKILEKPPEEDDDNTDAEDEQQDTATQDPESQDNSAEEEEEGFFNDFFGLLGGDDDDDAEQIELVVDPPPAPSLATDETTSEAVMRQVQAYLDAERQIIENPGTAWKEEWFVSACGTIAKVEVRFTADGKGGTLVYVPFEAITIYTEER